MKNKFLTLGVIILIGILFGLTTMFSILAITKKKLSRLDGALFIVLYFMYIAFAIVRNYCF